MRPENDADASHIRPASRFPLNTRRRRRHAAWSFLSDTSAVNTHARWQDEHDMVLSYGARSATDLRPSRTPSPLPNKRIRIANDTSSDDLSGNETERNHAGRPEERLSDQDAAENAVSATGAETRTATTTRPPVTKQDSTADTNAPTSNQPFFPLMSLPAEIRNEIYRACLTRPFNINLSKTEPIPDLPPNEESLLSGPETMLFGPPHLFPNGTDLLNHTAFQQWLAERNRGMEGPGLPTSSHPPRSNPRNHHGSTDPIANPLIAGMFVDPTLVYASASSASPPRPAQRPQDADPLIVSLLRVSKTVYQEARSILYSENHFTLNLDTALPTLAALHQRSRRQIKFVELEIPCYNEILERFQETVRLSLRYCWGLKTFIIHMPFKLPGSSGSGTAGNTTVYANGFDILRWLPRQCEVVLKGNVCAEIKAVVSKNANLAKTLDELAYARRQLISNENERT